MYFFSIVGLLEAIFTFLTYFLTRKQILYIKKLISRCILTGGPKSIANQNIRNDKLLYQIRLRSD